MKNAINVERLLPAVAGAVRPYWALLVSEGVVLILIGVLALLVPPLITLGITIVFGWFLVASGFAALIVSMWGHKAPRPRWVFASAIPSIGIGAVLIVRPFSGAISLTVLLAIFFILEGVTKIAYPFARCRYMPNYGGLMRVSGVVDLILGGIMLSGLPSVATWITGVLLGANMIFGGIALVVIGLLSRRHDDLSKT